MALLPPTRVSRAPDYHNIHHPSSLLTFCVHDQEELQKICNEKTKGVFFSIGKQGSYGDLVRGIVDVDFVARLERKNDTNTISNKTLDFSKTTIQQLIQDGYKETKEQLKEVLVME